MKRDVRAYYFLVPLFTILLISVLLMSGARADTTPDGYVYTVSDGKAIITGYTGSSTTLNIPSAVGASLEYPVTAIGDYAFHNRPALIGTIGTLMIPDSVSSIGDYAFYSCSGFTDSLVIPNSVTSIGKGAFGHCYGFTGSLVIPDSVTSIGGQAFDSCYGFTGSLVIPDSVSSIGDYTFVGCNGFTGSLVIPDSVSSIGDYTFAGCNGFTGSLTLPNGVTSIGDWAFYNCRGFTGSLVIPNSVMSIGQCAFNVCRYLNKVYILSRTYTLGDAAFSDSAPDFYGYAGTPLEDHASSLGKAFHAFGITLSGPESITAGETAQLRSEVTLLPGEPEDLVWSSSDANVAIVDQAGLVTALSPGTADITAASENFSCDFPMNVMPRPVTGIMLNEAVLELGIGESFQLSATISPANASDKTVTWTSNKPEVATVGIDGLVTANDIGSAKIRATANDGSDIFTECVVTVVTIGIPDVTVESSGPAGMKVTWPAAANAQNYEVERSLNENDGYEPVTESAALSFTDAGLTTGTRYYYRVRAILVIDSIKYSSDYSVPKAGIPFGKPTVSSVTAVSGTSVKVAWKAAAGADGYELWRSTSKTGTYKRVYAGTAKSITNKSLKAGTRYYYKVRATLTVEGETYFGAFGTIKAGVPLAKGTVTSATGMSPTSIKIVWKKVPGATGYMLFQSATANGTYKLIKTTTATSFTKTGLISGKQYFYKIKAYKKIGTAKYYGPLSAYKAGKTL